MRIPQSRRPRAAVAVLAGALSAALAVTAAPGWAGPGTDPENPNDDSTAPTIRVHLPPGHHEHWFSDTVTIRITAVDTGTNGGGASGLGPTSYTLSGATTGTGGFGLEKEITLSNEGSTRIDLVAEDRAENVATLTEWVGIDRTAPTVTFTSPANGASYSLGSQVPLTYGCWDGHSGVSSCTGNFPSGGLLDTSVLGERAVSVTTTDPVGNTRTTQLRYHVTPADLSVEVAPRIDGSAVVGRTLIARNPQTTPHAEETTYRWFRDGAAQAATGPTYRITPADIGHRIRVETTVRAAGHHDLTVSSAPTAVVPRLVSTMKAKGKAKRARKVVLKATVTAPGVTPTGQVIVRRGKKVVARTTVRNGKVVVKLRKQPRGKRKYTLSYSGSKVVTPRVVKVKVRVR